MQELSGAVLGIFVIVVSVVFIIGAIILGCRQRAAVDRAYQVVSERTGLTFTMSSNKGPATLTGNYRGHPVEVYTFIRRAGRYQVIFTGVIVSVANTTGATLEFTPANSLGKLLGKGAQSPAGAADSKAFDSRFKIKSQPPEFGMLALGDSAARARLMEISGGYSINLQGGSMKFSRNGRITDSATVEKVLSTLADVADRVEGRR